MLKIKRRSFLFLFSFVEDIIIFNLITPTLQFIAKFANYCYIEIEDNLQ